jgi:thiamine pyrophosphokinase
MMGSMKKSIAIIANGQIEDPEIIRPLILSHSSIIAVDGGLVHCKNLRIKPDLIVGDFDSCPCQLLQNYQDVQKKALFKDKDETDLEVAIQEAGGKHITLFAAWGRRIDHSLTNALLLIRYPGIKLETEREIVFAIEKTTHLNVEMGQTLSLIPINGPVSGISTHGLKWELKDAKLDQNFIGISNICIKEKIEISIKSNLLLCCLVKAPE